MAKTLKTGDVRKYSNEDVVGFTNGGWAVVSPEDGLVATFRNRVDARGFKNAAYEIGDRIAKIIKRTPKYVFVEVSK
jgi:hypothetical protein